MIKLRIDSINLRAEIAYILKLDLSREILYNYIQTNKRYISIESKQQRYKRKYFIVNQQRNIKRARCIVAQLTYLIATTL